MASALLTGCLPPDLGDTARSAGRAPAPHRGPVVLVTWSNLRADAPSFLGGPAGATPHLDELARHADFAGTSIAASSSPPVSAASLLLGVDPWQHQLLSHQAAELRADLPTLGTALGEVGYESTIYSPQASGLHRYGVFAGFDQAADLDLDRVVERLRSLDGGSQLIWIHLSTTELPWVASDGGDRVTLGDLYPYADPDRPLPAELREQSRRLYVEAVRQADAQLGQILDAIEGSGQRDQTLLAVTALHAMELGEHGQALYAQNLGRAAIQVPLLVDLPVDWSGTLHAPDDRGPADAPPVSALRLWPTLVQVVGGRALPVHRPSLFDHEPLPPLSALYLGNGVNLHSAVFAGRPDEPTEQVVVASRFAPAEPDFYRAQLAMASLPAPGLTESPRRMVERLRRPFLQAVPWSTTDAGDATVSWRLERWRRVRGVEPVDDAERAGRRAAEAYAAWSRWVGPEETPRQAWLPDS